MKFDQINIGKEYRIGGSWGRHKKHVVVKDILDGEDKNASRILIEDLDTKKTEVVHHTVIECTWESHEKQIVEEISRLKREQAEVEADIQKDQDTANQIAKNLQDLGFPVGKIPNFKAQNEDYYSEGEHLFRFTNEQMKQVLKWAQEQKSDGLGRIFN